jgi:hypothetical protein
MLKKRKQLLIYKIITVQTNKTINNEIYIHVQQHKSIFTCKLAQFKVDINKCEGNTLSL